ncbi:hypothetical protein GGQ06_003239 [Salinibacter ruber]|nr:hypothetical protein [Salinibacter ruber]
MHPHLLIDLYIFYLKFNLCKNKMINITVHRVMSLSSNLKIE